MLSKEQLKDEIRLFDKDMVQFVKEYLKDHYYLSSKKLAIEYEGCKSHEHPTRNCVWRFGGILSDLAKLGVVEKFNARSYRKKINWIMRLERIE